MSIILSGLTDVRIGELRETVIRLERLSVDANPYSIAYEDMMRELQYARAELLRLEGELTQKYEQDTSL